MRVDGEREIKKRKGRVYREHRVVGKICSVPETVDLFCALRDYGDLRIIITYYVFTTIKWTSNTRSQS